MVYIIDDDQSILDAMDLLMRAAGFDALTFSSTLEFLERVTPSNHDCIILDLCMPGMDGFELLKTLSVRGATVPVIVLSALDDAQSRERARETGANAYFKKPVDDQALIDMIRWCMQKNPECKG
jgi:FixJ family two-component response regulator